MAKRRALKKALQRKPYSMSPWIIGLIILVIGLVIGFYSGTQKALRSSSRFVARSTPSPTHASKKYASKLKFDPNTKFVYEKNYSAEYVRRTASELAGIEYPQELTMLKNDQLVDFLCSSVYRDDYEGGYEAYINNQSVKLTDTQLLSYIENITAHHNKAPFSFQKCVTEHNEIFVAYSSFTNLGKSERTGGGGAADYYFGTIVGTTFSQIAAIPNDSAPYASCNSPLAYTTDHNLYYICGGGEGGLGQATIVKVNMVTKGVKSILSCKSTSRSDGTGMNISCDK